MGAQGSKGHSLSFQVNSKARDEGGEPEPSEDRSELPEPSEERSELESF